MQIDYEIDLPNILGHSCFVVLWLLAKAKASGIDPVTRLWLLEHMERRTSPNTATAALRWLTDHQYIHRVTGGWRVNADHALQLPLSAESQKRAERAFDITNHEPEKRAERAFGEPVVVVASDSTDSLLSRITTTTTESEKRAERAFDITKHKRLKALHAVGIIGKKAQELAELEWVTPAYIEAALIDSESANNSVGMAIIKIEAHQIFTPKLMHWADEAAQARAEANQEGGNR